MQGNTRRTWSKALRWLGHVAAAVGIAIVVRTLLEHFEELPPVSFSAPLVFALCGGVAANLIVTLLSAWLWKIILRNGGSRISFRQSYAITGKAQIAKYLPGNVFHLIGRGAMASLAGVPPSVAAWSIGLETFLIAATAVFISFPLVFLDWEHITPLLPAGQAWMHVAAVTVVILIGAFMAWTLRGRIHASFQNIFRIPAFTTVLRAFAINGVIFVLLGTALWAVALAAWPDQAAPNLLIFIMAFSLAWVLGFITPGAPAGIGVREAVFMLAISPVAGVAAAATLAVVSRLFSLVTDGLYLGISLAISGNHPIPCRGPARSPKSSNI